MLHSTQLFFLSMHPSSCQIPLSLEHMQTLCLIGYRCPDASQRIQCNPGEYCPEGSVNAAVCSEGHYCVYPGLQIKCGSGTYCPAGSTTPSLCDAGMLCDGGGNKIVCPSSYACPPGASQPSKCLDTTWSDQKSSACLPCPGKLRKRLIYLKHPDDLRFVYMY